MRRPDKFFLETIWRRQIGNQQPAPFTPPPPVVEVASATISPATSTLEYGLTQQFTLVAKDAFGTVIGSPPAPTWFAGSNKDGSAWGTVDSSGLFTASKNDASDLAGYIHATYPNGVVSQNAGITEILLDHLTLGISASSVIETATAPTLTLNKWRDSAGTVAFGGTTTIVYSSDATSVATIDPATGAITLQGPGNVNFTATDSISGKFASVALTVTSEVLTATPSSLSVTAGAAPSAPLVIKDQNGVDVTAGCTFATSNASIATVDSSGVVTYVAAGTCNITATHTADNETCTIGVTVSASSVNYDTTAYTPGTGAGIFGSTGAAPITYDTANDHTDDTEFRTHISSNLETYLYPAKAGTGTSGSKYSDGAFPDAVTWQTAVTYGGQPTYKNVGMLPYSADGTRFGQLKLGLPTPKPSVWIAVRRMWPSGMTATGDADHRVWGDSYNSGATLASAFTITPAITSPGLQTVATSTQYVSTSVSSLIVDPGGANQETLYGSANNGVPAPGQFQTLGNSPNSIAINPTKTHAAGVAVTVTFAGSQNNGFKISPVAGTNNGRCSLEIGNGTNLDAVWSDPVAFSTSIAETYTGANITNEFTDATWEDVVMFAEQFTGVNGHTYIGFTMWHRNIGDAAYVRYGYRHVQDTGGSSTGDFVEVSGFCLNYNQARVTELAYYIWGHAAWDHATNSDPLGILAHEATLNPEACTVGAVTSQTSTTATFPISLGRYAKYVRPVIDGVEDASQEYAIPLDVGDIRMSDNGSANLNPYVLSQTITGMTTATHTISFNIYNGNKTAFVNTGDQSVTLVVAPGALASISDATAGLAAGTTLTFPITLNASGSVPTAIEWDYSTNGGSTWNPGTDYVLSSPSLGEATTFTASGLTVSTAYSIRAREKNGAGSSADSATVTGTTTAGETLPTTTGALLLALEATNADVSSNGAAIGSITDQSASGIHIFATGTTKPTLVTGATTNAQPAITLASGKYLVAAAYNAAMSVDNCMIFVVASLNSSSSTDRAIFSNRAATTTGWAQIISKSSGADAPGFRYGSTFNNQTARNAAFKNYETTISLSGSVRSITEYVDGSVVGGAANDVTVLNTTVPIAVGTDSASPGTLTGDSLVSAIYVVAGTLAADRTAVESFIRTKWGTT